MAASACTLFLVLLFSCSAASAFNITKILSQSVGFGTFNSLLTQTQLADEINRRQTLTVLAVPDGAISAISGKPIDVIKKVLSVHVVLDYYDTDKLKNLKKKTALLTTLFQSTGMADGQMGFLNVTVTSTGEVKLGSAIPGAGLVAQVEKPVAMQPYNISVLQVSGVISPPGIENTNQSSTPPPAQPVPTPSASPKAAPAPAATPAPKSAPAPASSAPSSSTPAPSASSPASKTPPTSSPPSPSAPSEAPSSDETPAPSSDSPGGAPTPSGDADVPASDVPSDGGEAPSPSDESAAARVVLGTGLGAVVGAALLAALY